MAAPQEYAVQNPRKDEKGKTYVTVAGREMPVWVPKGEQMPELSGEVKGWINPSKDGGGEYFRPATDKPSQPRSNGSSQPARDDATGRSIERQVAAKCATELLASTGGAQMALARDPKFAEAFHFVADTISDAIAGEQKSADEQIPFG